MAFYQHLGKYDSKKAVVSEEGSATYKELETCTETLRSKLPSRSLVVHFCENTIGSVCGYLGFLRNQIVPILLQSQIDDAFANRLLNIYQPDYIFAPNKMKDKFPRHRAVSQAFDYSVLETDYRYEHRLHRDLALLMSTSGSTGSPKLVRQSYQNIQSNAESIAQYLELDENERPLCFLPMNYSYGLSVINSHVLVGATLVLTQRSLFERELWNLCEQHEATSFSGIPYAYKMLKKLQFQNMDLPALRTLTQAGGKLSTDMQQEFGQYAKDQNKRFFVMYGQTEATARMSYLPHEKALEKLGSIGFAIPGGRFSIVDADENIVEKPGVAGELVYEGPNVALGYAEAAADLAKGDEWRGKLKTGDMATLDSDGYYYIVGRKKRFLKMFGNRVNLDDAERMLQDQFQSFECACAGADDCMTVFITSDSEKIKAEVTAFLSGKTGLHPSGFVVRFIPQLPKNAAGKIQYAALEHLSCRQGEGS